MSSLGERIKFAREQKRLLQSDLATLISVKSAGVISNWEKDINKPDAEKIVKLCDVLNVSASYLLDYYGKSEFNINAFEYEYIKKYRLISENDMDGKSLVDSTVDYLCIRIQEKNTMLEEIQHQSIANANIIEMQPNRIPTHTLTYLHKVASAGRGEYLFDSLPTDTIEVPTNKISEMADFVIGVNGDSMEPTYYDGDKVYVQGETEISEGEIGIFTQGNDWFIKEAGKDCLKSHNHQYPDITSSEDIHLVGRVLGKVEENQEK